MIGLIIAWLCLPVLVLGMLLDQFELPQVETVVALLRPEFHYLVKTIVPIATFWSKKQCRFRTTKDPHRIFIADRRV